MEIVKPKSKSYKWLIVTGSLLLTLMAIFHASGTPYVSEMMNQSNADGLLKEIFPVLFLNPTLHLITLAAFAVASIYLTKGYKIILTIVSAAAIVNAIMAFYLGANIPGILLILASSCFAVAVLRSNNH